MTAVGISVTSTQRAWLERAAPVLIFVVALALAWGRLDGANRGAMWAEDGNIFSQRALDPSLQTAGLLTPYAGYTHAVPQLIASVTWALVPIEKVAIAFTAASCATAAAVAALIWVFTRSWRLNVPGRLLLCLITVLVPGLNYEVLGNLANIHWFLLWLSPFMFWFVPRRWWSAVAVGVLAFFVVATEIQALIFAPFMLWKAKDRRRWPLYAGAIAGAIVQMSAYFQNSPSRGDGQRSVPAAIMGYFVQVPLTALTGTGQSASAAVGFSGWMIAYIAILPFVAAGVIVAMRSRRSLIVVATLILASFLLWTAGFLVNFLAPFDFSAMNADTLKAGIPLLRYCIVPMMFLLALVALAVGANRDAFRLGEATRSNARSWILPAMGAVLLCALFTAGYTTNVAPHERQP